MQLLDRQIGLLLPAGKDEGKAAGESRDHKEASEEGPAQDRAGRLLQTLRAMAPVSEGAFSRNERDFGIFILRACPHLC